MATIPVQAEATSSSPTTANDCAQPLVVRASVVCTTLGSDDGGGAVLDVTPPYLYLGEGGPHRPQLRLRLLAHRPGRHHGLLVLEYSGRRAEVAVRGSISHGDEGHWVTTADRSTERTSERHERRPQAPPTPPSPAPGPAVSFGRVCVGCAVSRELRLRNCMAGDCFVRTYVEGGG